MLTLIKQIFCRHQSIRTTSESGINAIGQGYFFVKTMIVCSDCKKSFPRHPRELCCHVMHINHETIRDCIATYHANQFRDMQNSQIKVKMNHESL